MKAKNTCRVLLNIIVKFKIAKLSNKNKGIFQ